MEYNNWFEFKKKSGKYREVIKFVGKGGGGHKKNIQIGSKFDKNNRAIEEEMMNLAQRKLKNL